MSIDLRDGFAPTRTEVVENGRLLDLAAILALGRRRRKVRRVQLSVASLALVLIAGLTGLYVLPFSATALPLGPGGLVRATAVPLGKQLDLFQVVPVSARITYALASKSSGDQWVLAVTTNGGGQWQGYQVPLVTKAQDARLIVLAPTVVRISEPAGHAVISHDSGVTWTGAAGDVGQQPNDLRTDYPAGYPAGYPIAQLPGTPGLSILDPDSGAANQLHTGDPAVQVGGYQAVSASDGTLWGFGPYGGRPAGNPSTVWVSRDDGQSWRAWAPRPSVPQQAGGGVTTGDGTVGYLLVEASEDTRDGSKVYVTRDHGEHWTYVASTAVVLTQPQLLADNRTLIAVHQTDAGEAQLYRSADGGKTFLRVGLVGRMTQLTSTAGGYALTSGSAHSSTAMFSADGLSWSQPYGPPVR